MSKLQTSCQLGTVIRRGNFRGTQALLTSAPPSSNQSANTSPIVLSTGDIKAQQSTRTKNILWHKAFWTKPNCKSWSRNSQKDAMVLTRTTKQATFHDTITTWKARRWQTDTTSSPRTFLTKINTWTWTDSQRKSSSRRKRSAGQSKRAGKWASTWNSSLRSPFASDWLIS